MPTFLEALGRPVPTQRLEGRALQPLLHGQKPDNWREAAFSEIDYCAYNAARVLDLPADQARAYMIRTERWKYVHYTGFRPQLFDLTEDPDELTDVATDPANAEVLREMEGKLLDRVLSRKNRVAISDDQIAGIQQKAMDLGISIGDW